MGHLTHLMNWITSIRGSSYFSHFTVHLAGGSWVASPAATPSYNDQLSAVCALDLLLTFSAWSLSVSLPSPCAGCWCRQEWRFPVRKEREWSSALPQQSASGYKWPCRAAFCSCSVVFSSLPLAAEAALLLRRLSWRWSLGGPEGEAEIERDWISELWISELWKTSGAFRPWRQRNWMTVPQDNPPCCMQ